VKPLYAVTQSMTVSLPLVVEATTLAATLARGGLGRGRARRASGLNSRVLSGLGGIGVGVIVALATRISIATVAAAVLIVTVAATAAGTRAGRATARGSLIPNSGARNLEAVGCVGRFVHL
jgi:hypothetical protein